MMNDFSEIVFYAFRYALGRMTYAPYTVVNFIWGNIDKITTHDIKLMIEEIKEVDERNGLGMNCDIKMWLEFRAFLMKELEKRNETN